MRGDPGQAFSDDDRRQLAAHGVGFDDAVRQLELLREPSGRFRKLDRPALPGDGVVQLPSRLLVDYLSAADRARIAGRVSKFVPASGAATRMFQSLLHALDEFERGTIDDAARGEVERFLEAIPRLAMRHELAHKGISTDEPIPSADRDRSRLLYRILSATEAGFAALPKGLVPFHEDGGRARTPFEEHLLEALLYAKDANGIARAHFTVPDGSRSEFERLLQELGPALEGRCHGRLEVTFSAQKSSTDTIATDSDGLPFRDDDGRLFLRPGGHGSVLPNLQETGGDIVVIKNIDNVVPPRMVQRIVYWKNILIGCLATLQQSAHVYLREIHEDGASRHWLTQGLRFAEQNLSIHVPEGLHRASAAEQKDFLVRMFDRPIRVCGVVKNEGEPGGGPFWVSRPDGSASLQIVECAEVDLDDESQAAAWRSSTHFNPVDLVVGLRNWRGEPYDLAVYSDPDAVFRTTKTNGGRILTALERPGLWNGAMSNWTTIFVEVPLETFAPVKTIFDLLRPEHC